MSLILYNSPNSQPCRAVLTFLHLTKIPYESKFISIINGDHYSPEFLKVNPLHAIPVIVDDDFVLTESVAIVLYLMDSRDVGKEYYPEDPKKRALINQYTTFHHQNLRPKLTRLFTYFWKPEIVKGRKDNIRKEALDISRQFQEGFLKDGDYIAGDVFTIADMFAVNEFTQIYYTVDMDFNEVPVVKRYIERCLENKVLYDVNESIRGFPEMMRKAMVDKGDSDIKK